jgi:hypothetical protein
MDEVLKIDEDLVEEYLKRSKDRRKLWDDLDAADAVERKAGGEIIEGKDGGREEDDDGEKPPSKRMTYERENYRESCWWKFIQRDNLDDLNSRDGKTFRNRFTVPFQLFLELLTLAKTWFPQRDFDVFGNRFRFDITFGNYS